MAGFTNKDNSGDLKSSVKVTESNVVDVSSVIYSNSTASNNVEEVDFSATTSGNPTNISTYTSSTDQAQIESVLANMSQEDYDAYIEELKGIYDQDIDYYNTMLENTNSVLDRFSDSKAMQMYKTDYLDENGAIGRKQQILDVLYKFVTSGEYKSTGYTQEQIENMSDNEKIAYICDHSEEAKQIKDEWDQAKKENADPYIKSKFGDLGINTLDEFVQYRNELLSTKEYLENAIQTTNKMKESAYYDNLQYLGSYSDFEVPKATQEQRDYVKSLTGITYSYNEYRKKFPNSSPLQFVKLVLEEHQNTAINITGIDGNDGKDLEQLTTIAKLSDKCPNLEKTYEYLYKNEPTKASKFLTDCDYEINNYTGQVWASEFFDTLDVADGQDDVLGAVANELKVSKQGLLDGILSFRDGTYYSLEALGTALGIIDENRTMSAEEYKKMYILYGLFSQEDKEKLNLIEKDPVSGEYVNKDQYGIIDYTKEYSGGGLLSASYEISQGIGSFLPTIALSAALTYICPMAGMTEVAAASLGSTVGSAAMGVSAGGSAYHNAMVSGSSFRSSLIYGIYTGTTTALSQKLLGSIPFLSNIKVSDIVTYIQAMGHQANQATVQYVLDSLAKDFILGNDPPSTAEEWQDYFQGLFKSASYAAITSGILNLPCLGTSIYGKLKFDKTMKKLGYSSDQIKEAINNYRNEHPEAKNMTDNEIKNSFGAKIISKNCYNTLMNSGSSADIDTWFNSVQGQVYDIVSNLSADERKAMYSKLKDQGYFSGDWAPSEELFVKYANIFLNTKYCDPKTGGIHWPNGEGTVEFSHLTDAQMMSIGTTNGIDALLEIGGEVVDISDLSELRRISNSGTRDGDVNGEYFGNTTDSVDSRSLQPYTQENGKPYDYTFTGSDGTNKTVTINGKKMIVGKDIKITAVKTHAAPYYDCAGGAEQYVFYVTDMSGKMIVRQGANNLYKLNVGELQQLGIIE